MKKKFRLSVIFATILSLVAVTGYFGNESVVNANPVMKVHVLDVDDSGFIVQLPNGKVMVVDAGRGTELTKVKNRINALGITTIDYLVGTHAHSDHIANFDSLINTYTVGGVYFPGAPAPCSNGVCTDMKNAANANSVPITYLDMGDTIFPSTTVNGLTLSSFVFAPDANENYSSYYSPGTTSYMNANSLVFNLTYGAKSILFTGDIYEPAQDKISADFSLANNEIMTAPHHGYGGTNQASFLDYVEAAGTDKIIIHLQKTCGTVIDFKYLLQQRGTSEYWSTAYNQDYYHQTDGISWSDSETAEWSPGDPVVVPPADHSC